MIRKITADEVRHFMEVCDKQFREAGFFINSIKFIRTDDKTTLEDITLIQLYIYRI